MGPIKKVWRRMSNVKWIRGSVIAQLLAELALPQMCTWPKLHIYPLTRGITPRHQEVQVQGAAPGGGGLSPPTGQLSRYIVVVSIW